VEHIDHCSVYHVLCLQCVALFI